MISKQIKITYSNGEEDEFFLNEELDEDLMQEALERLDLQVIDDIFGDVGTPKENKNDYEGKR